VLVVMEYRDIQVALQLRFNIKALRAADILQVDAAKSRSDGLDSGNNFLAGGAFRQMGNASTPPNSLNRTHLPSMTGRPASGPMLPRPSTAVPFVTTATVRPLKVYLYTSSGFALIWRQGSATPGV
jgi:hypothetical protein